MQQAVDLNEIFVFVPIKLNSVRVPHKNFIPFYNNQNLTDIKIKQLLKIFNKKDINLLLTDERIKFFTEKYDTNIIVNDDENSIIPLAVKENLKKHHKYILRCCVTSPFVNQNIIRNAIHTFIESKNDFNFMISAEKIRSHVVSSSCKGLNFSSNSIETHPKSQMLDEVFILNSGMFMFETKTMSNFKNMFTENSIKPLMYPLNKIEAIDINYPDDYDICVELLKNKYLSKKYL